MTRPKETFPLGSFVLYRGQVVQVIALNQTTDTIKTRDGVRCVARRLLSPIPLGAPPPSPSQTLAQVFIMTDADPDLFMDQNLQDRIDEVLDAGQVYATLAEAKSAAATVADGYEVEGWTGPIKWETDRTRPLKKPSSWIGYLWVEGDEDPVVIFKIRRVLLLLNTTTKEGDE